MTDRLESLVSDCVAPLGMDVEAVELRQGGRRKVLRIALDADGGIGIDQITTATRALNEALDSSDVMGAEPYTLEVTSRGVERPLTLPRHWRRNTGRLVRVTLADDSTLDGRIGDSDDTGVELTTKKDATRIPYDQITTALVQTELNRKDA
ncbi:ribosome maturation factor RimP [Aeromicrobium panaciterrae]|uniref:ribosome maturation factor RimP n=1 Tax=Aeromicrobium panaciterrae TaxID=363861 RepID=UPI0031D4A632